MKKRLLILLTVFISSAATGLHAQDYLPEYYSIILGGGISLPKVEGNQFAVQFGK